MVAKKSLYLVLDLPNVAQDVVDFFVAPGWVGEDITLHKEVRSHCFWGIVVNDGVDRVVWEKCANDRVARESLTNKWISICCEQQSSMIPQLSENRQLDEGAHACFLAGTWLVEGCVRTFLKICLLYHMDLGMFFLSFLLRQAPWTPTPMHMLTPI